MDYSYLDLMRNKTLYLSEKDIDEICIHFNLKCSFTTCDMIFVSSKISNWRIFHGKGKHIKIYHENFKPDINFNKKHKKFSEGFHQQEIEVKNLYEAIRYIYWHDKKLFKDNVR